ncbi:hypothetical protein E2C01_093239 [Portunus trituberculatus]|uniref:Uncharacterized protein n=1 Tax=Portunus trituberculatus TaxID=210409 RepID=A0A5B7JY25_PORTR|nr:hypothetical protein [Portunus trituberculatus]
MLFVTQQDSDVPLSRQNPLSKKQPLRPKLSSNFRSFPEKYWRSRTWMDRKDELQTGRHWRQDKEGGR